MKITFALRFVKFVAFLLFKDSPGYNQTTKEIITTRKVIYLIF